MITEKPTQKLRLMKKGHGDLLLAEWEVEHPETIPTARKAFQDHFTAGRMAFRLNAPGDQVLIKEFDETANEILLVPAIQGG